MPRLFPWRRRDYFLPALLLFEHEFKDTLAFTGNGVEN